ncbi:hypothetical protein P171DRAFT_100542 [Karstenula rhodostoma CBS 690.94]|uniref:AA1-like domain-containing protein n=1 Tax=Karstenula rhodostoma CBS 690.94 TaxID=1392251 RepID=A0A9P4P8K7_9PLEO|nr:hypothetical protein P171DRAFT_100542 [Karstenula rhodostoma CBS 690.94]
MLLPHPFLLFLPLALALALPTTTPLTWLVSNFNLTIDRANRTSLTFRFHDPSPTHYTALTCVTNTTQAMHACGPNREVLYKISEGEVILRRRMSANSTSMGTARQGTNWVEGVNVTETEGGRVYARDEDWAFAVTSVSG